MALALWAFRQAIGHHLSGHYASVQYSCCLNPCQRAFALEIGLIEPLTWLTFKSGYRCRGRGSPSCTYLTTLTTPASNVPT